MNPTSPTTDSFHLAQLNTLASTTSKNFYVHGQGDQAAILKANWLRKTFEIIKGLLGFGDRSSPEILEGQFIRLLGKCAAEGSITPGNPADYQKIKLAAQNAGLIPKSGSLHKELNEIINSFATDHFAETYSNQAEQYFKDHSSITKYIGSTIPALDNHEKTQSIAHSILQPAPSNLTPPATTLAQDANTTPTTQQPNAHSSVVPQNTPPASPSPTPISTPPPSPPLHRSAFFIPITADDEKEDETQHQEDKSPGDTLQQQADGPPTTPLPQNTTHPSLQLDEEADEHDSHQDDNSSAPSSQQSHTQTSDESPHHQDTEYVSLQEQEPPPPPPSPTPRPPATDVHSPSPKPASPVQPAAHDFTPSVGGSLAIQGSKPAKVIHIIKEPAADTSNALTLIKTLALGALGSIALAYVCYLKLRNNASDTYLPSITTLPTSSTIPINGLNQPFFPHLIETNLSFFQDNTFYTAYNPPQFILANTLDPSSYNAVVNLESPQSQQASLPVGTEDEENEEFFDTHEDSIPPLISSDSEPEPQTLPTPSQVAIRYDFDQFKDSIPIPPAINHASQIKLIDAIPYIYNTSKPTDKPTPTEPVCAAPPAEPTHTQDAAPDAEPARVVIDNTATPPDSSTKVPPETGSTWIPVSAETSTWITATAGIALLVLRKFFGATPNQTEPAARAYSAPTSTSSGVSPLNVTTTNQTLAQSHIEGGARDATIAMKPAEDTAGLSPSNTTSHLPYASPIDASAALTEKPIDRLDTLMQTIRNDKDFEQLIQLIFTRRDKDIEYYKMSYFVKTKQMALRKSNDTMSFNKALEEAQAKEQAQMLDTLVALQTAWVTNQSEKDIIKIIEDVVFNGPGKGLFEISWLNRLKENTDFHLAGAKKNNIDVIERIQLLSQPPSYIAAQAPIGSPSPATVEQPAMHSQSDLTLDSMMIEKPSRDDFVVAQKNAIQYWASLKEEKDRKIYGSAKSLLSSVGMNTKTLPLRQGIPNPTYKNCFWISTLQALLAVNGFDIKFKKLEPISALIEKLKNPADEISQDDLDDLLIPFYLSTLKLPDMVVDETGTSFTEQGDAGDFLNFLLNQIGIESTSILTYALQQENEKGPIKPLQQIVDRITLLPPYQLGKLTVTGPQDFMAINLNRAKLDPQLTNNAQMETLIQRDIIDRLSLGMWEEAPGDVSNMDLRTFKNKYGVQIKQYFDNLVSSQQLDATDANMESFERVVRNECKKRGTYIADTSPIVLPPDYILDLSKLYYKDNNSVRYKIVGIVEKIPDGSLSINNGHYVAHTIENGHYFTYDDDVVRCIDKASFDKKAQQANILMLQLITEQPIRRATQSVLTYPSTQRNPLRLTDQPYSENDL